MVKCYVFSAHWCGPCRVLHKKLEDFKDCEVVNHDVDELEEDVLDKYKISGVPVTLLVDDDGNEIQRWVGLFDLKELSDKIKEVENG